MVNFFFFNYFQEKAETLKGSLSALKLMPGTYFSHTGNPLWNLTVKISTSWYEHVL